MEKKTKKAIKYGAIGAVVGAAAGIGIYKLVGNDDDRCICDKCDDDDSDLENAPVEVPEEPVLDHLDT